MVATIFNSPMLVNPPIINRNAARMFQVVIESPRVTMPCHSNNVRVRLSKPRVKCSYSSAQSNGSADDQSYSVQELTVPNHWLEPSKASEESEWLRVTLHKWLDDEYCPEDTNIEISKIAANSFYKSLLEKRADLGEILLQMALELESISYQESFHGAFSSANAAVSLIVQRISEE